MFFYLNFCNTSLNSRNYEHENWTDKGTFCLDSSQPYLKIFGQDFQPTLSQFLQELIIFEKVLINYQIVDDIELIIVIVCRIDFTMIALSHVLHKDISVGKRLLAIDTLVAIHLFAQVLNVLLNEDQIVRRAKIQMTKI